MIDLGTPKGTLCILIEDCVNYRQGEIVELDEIVKDDVPLARLGERAGAVKREKLKLYEPLEQSPLFHTFQSLKT